MVPDLDHIGVYLNEEEWKTDRKNKRKNKKHLDKHTEKKLK